MKKMLGILLLVCPVAFAAQAAETYIFDPTHTAVLWHISHFDFSYPSGKWMAEGTLVLDEAKPQNSKVNVLIHTGDIVTGVPKLDEHLRDKLFFDVQEFPTATFVSDKVTVTGKDKAKVHGMLTVRGIAKPVTLQVTLNKLDISPITDKKTVGFGATTQVKRSDFNVGGSIPGLGDDVKIEIQAEAAKSA